MTKENRNDPEPTYPLPLPSIAFLASLFLPRRIYRAWAEDVRELYSQQYLDFGLRAANLWFKKEVISSILGFYWDTLLNNRIAKWIFRAGIGILFVWILRLIGLALGLP